MDSFFQYYFLIVGALFILTLIYESVKYFMQDQEDWQFELANDVLNWCLELYPIRKQKPQLTLVDGESTLAGEYNFYTNTIVIYRVNNVLRHDLVRTLSHEYFHYYLINSESKNTLYQKQLDQYGYDSHPQEILCNSMGDTLAKLYLQKN